MSNKAIILTQFGGTDATQLSDILIPEAAPGMVVVRVRAAGINGLDWKIREGYLRDVMPTVFLTVLGQELAGEVHATAEGSRFTVGDRVFGLAAPGNGAYADYARVPAEWVVPLPDGLSLYEAMGLGTSGLTAALAVDRFERAGLKPGDGPVAVTGASGGVGSLAVDMLAGRGFEVVAISGKAEQTDFLKSIGASRVLSREAFMQDKSPLVSSPPFAGALDNVGGAMLDRLAANLMPHGKVAVAGMVGVELTTTVLPLVLRSIDILGINVSRQLKMPERRRLWQRMATDLKPRHLDRIARPIPFADLDKTMDSFFNVSSVGRVVVEVGSAAPR